MAPQDKLEHEEATEVQDLTRLLYALRPPEREVQVPLQVDLTIRAEIWKTQVRQQVIALLPMAHQELAQTIQQALLDNPMLEEVAPAEDEDAPAGEEHAAHHTASADDLMEDQEGYANIWQACIPDGWDANGLPAQASEAPGASEHPIGPPDVILPDMIVMKMGNDYRAFLNDEGMPRLRISATYQRMLREGKLGEPEAKHYPEDKLRSAVWLICSIEQRRQTLLKVATSLVALQRDFLDHGFAHLKPLMLTAVADALGMHESIVSLVITNKYLSTAHGIVALTSFFHSGLKSSGGEPRSSLTVTEASQLIAAEASTHPQPVWPPGSRLSPDEEQWVHQAIEEQRARRPAWLQDWLHRKSLETWMLAADPETRAAYRDLQTALAHPQLRPAVLLALRAFAQAAKTAITTPSSESWSTSAAGRTIDTHSSPSPSDAIAPVPRIQELPAVREEHMRGIPMVSQSPKMQEVFRRIERILHTTATVLIMGERGTGKGLVARILHDHGSRRQGPFMAVSCAGIPETRLEVEIFRHIERAAGGTLFVDGITEISPTLQAKLLRVLQEGRFEQIESAESLPTNARIIAAATPELERLIGQGKFRR